MAVDAVTCPAIVYTTNEHIHRSYQSQSHVIGNIPTDGLYLGGGTEAPQPVGHDLYLIAALTGIVLREQDRAAQVVWLHAVEVDDRDVTNP
jgi:hypothetical protein